MIKFKKPENLNGAELLDELAEIGIILDKVNEAPIIDGNGDLWLRVEQSQESAVASIISAHNGTTIAPEPTIEDKLASVGLSLNDLKAALGLGGN